MSKFIRLPEMVEAREWIDTNSNRLEFSDWFDAHDREFETFGSVVLLPNGERVPQGWWIYWNEEQDEFFGVPSSRFLERYRAATEDEIRKATR